MSDQEIPRSDNPWKRFWVAGAGLVLAALALGIWMATRSQTVPPIEAGVKPSADNFVELSPEAQRNANLKIAEVEERPLERTLAATGIVTPDSNRLAHVRPLARGVVEQVLVQLGDRVEAGASLLNYDNIELGELIGEYLTVQAEIEREQAQVEVARSYLGRAESLLAVEAIAQKEYELRDAQYKQAVAVVESRKAELAQVEEKIHRLGLSDEDLRSLRRSGPGAHRTVSHNVLRAPFAGVIIMQDAAVGEILEPDREVFTLADLSVVWVLADIYEKDLGQVAVGQTARVRVPAYSRRSVRAGEKLGQERRESGGPWRSKNRPPEICLRKRCQEERFVGYRRDVHRGAICTRSARGLC